MIGHIKSGKVNMKQGADIRNNISIIIPVYNVETYIEQCLHSVISGVQASASQSIEVLIIDDGSTDSSGLGFGKTTGDISKEKAMKALQAFLRPEFLGRVDEVIVFSPLSVENYADIAKLMMKEMIEALSENGTLAAIAEKYKLTNDLIANIGSDK